MQRAPGAQETDALFRRWRNHGDRAARDAIFERHLPMARRLASRYRSGVETHDDLFQVTALGLLGVIDRYDPDRGVAFSGFAIPTMLGELKRYFRIVGWSAHVARPGQELALRVRRASRELSAVSGRGPRVSELAQYLELSTEEVLTGLAAAAAQYSVSLDAPASTQIEEASSLGETLGREDEGYRLVETTAWLSGAAQHLLVAERRALAMRLAHDMKQSEIAEQLGCSQMQVSRLLRSAAAKLRALAEPSSVLGQPAAADKRDLSIMSEGPPR